MEVKLNASDLNASREAIQNAGTNLSEVKPSMTDVSSNSAAMEAFLERVKELKRLKKDYEELLESDCAALLIAQNTMSAADASIASSFGSTASASE